MTAIYSASALAQAPVEAPLTPAAPASAAAPVPPPAPLPIVDPAKELKGAALIEALRKGGFVLYMRHAMTGTVTEKCGPSNLSPKGEQDARSVGAAMRELKIPVGAVRSSQPCRCVDTARELGVGKVEITEDLNPVSPREGFDLGAARTRRLVEMPATGTNTILVSHLHGSRNKAEWVHLEMGEVIVFHPDGGASPVAVARIPLTAWAALKQAMGAGG
ncbi:MAG: histidine phosphatase family protein [Usitatibacteraceae bacterium]